MKNIIEQVKALTKKKENISPSIITAYRWQGAGDGSLLVCKENGSFLYYQSAEDLTNNYFEGSYEFYMGNEAVKYITTTLKEYGVTQKKLKQVWSRNNEYDISNFICFVLNNETCMMDGQNVLEQPCRTPYFGFCLKQEDGWYFDVANMNTANYYYFIAV